MPTYVYRREDGSTFEIEQRITADPLAVCPETGQKVERVITGAGLIFKGSGFYLTDYARKNENGTSPGDSKSKPDAKESAEPATATEKKPADTAKATSTSQGSSSSDSKSTD